MRVGHVTKEVGYGHVYDKTDDKVRMSRKDLSRWRSFGRTDDGEK